MNRPNLLFVFSDQQRRQAVGFAGADPVQTPHLDRFARESVVVDHALACCPICTPNRGIMMTGLYPTRTGVYANDQGLAPDCPTIGHDLRQAGYWTGYIGKWHIHAGDCFVPRAYRSGFDYWHATNCNHEVFTQKYWEEGPDPVLDVPGWQPPHETAVAQRCLRERPKGQPFALFVAYTPPHNTHGPGFDRHAEVELPPDQAAAMHAAGYPLEMQYHAPEEWERGYRSQELPRRGNVPGDYAQAALPGYLGSCTAIDHEFGVLLQSLAEAGLADNTIVVYTSDHGEMLGSHGRMQKSSWHEESVGVPLLVRWPGQLAPRRLPLVFNSLDWVPTLLGLLGIAPARPLDGSDLTTDLHAGAGEERAALLGYFAMRCTAMDGTPAGVAQGWRALRTRDRSYVVTAGSKSARAEHRCYDLVADPLQLRPRVANGVIDAGLVQRLHARLTAVNDPFVCWL
jgi:arylsulfatase A-like enzyme